MNNILFKIIIVKTTIYKGERIMKQEFHKNAHSGAVYGLGFLSEQQFILFHVPPVSG